MNFKKRGWHFTASSIRKERLREWIVTFWEEHWKSGQKEEGEWICKGERWICPSSSRDQPYSWEPLSLLEIDTIMDLIMNTHNGVGIEHQRSHQLPWNIHAKKAIVIFSTKAHHARLQICRVNGHKFLLQRHWQYTVLPYFWGTFVMWFFFSFSRDLWLWHIILFISAMYVHIWHVLSAALPLAALVAFNICPKQHGNGEGETLFACVKQDSYTCS